MAGIRTDEPQPRSPAAAWSPVLPPVLRVEELARPKSSPLLLFADVIEARRSRIGNSVTWSQIAGLLWHAAAARGTAETGRAGLPIRWTNSPSAGGLGCISIVCIPDDGSPAKLYEPIGHKFLVLAADPAPIRDTNREEVRAVTGAARGCTLRLIGDWAKISAAYENAESLLYRDAGHLSATLGLCAEWLGLCACPLGFLGNAILPLLGLPADYFRGAGAVLVGDARDNP